MGTFHASPPVSTLSLSGVAITLTLLKMYPALLKILLILTFTWQLCGADVPKGVLPEGTVKVVAYLYDYTAENSYAIAPHGKLHIGVIPKYTRTLSKEDTQHLLDAFTEKHESRQRPLCEPEPHHAFVFYGDGDKIIGSVSICFQCKTTYSSHFTHARDPLRSFWDWKELEELFIRNGFPILETSDQYTALRTQSGKQ